MNRYKKELTLQGYTNLPTMKNVISKRTGNVLKRIDSFDIKNLKMALDINKPMMVPAIEINFTIQYLDKKTEKIIHTSHDQKFANMMDKKALISSIKEYQRKNTKNDCQIFSHYDENDNGVYKEARSICLYSLKVRKQKRSLVGINQ